MASTIKIRRSAIQGAIPTTSQLSLGELGINTFDGKLFLKQSTTGSETGAGTTIVDVTGYSYDWVTNESGIHTSSNVGIGTTNPDGPLVVNAASGFSGNLLDLQVDGTSKLSIDSTGQANVSGDLFVGINTAPVVSSDITGVSGADVITNIISLTQAEYDAIITPDPSTFYVITA